ncbi:competence protein ComEC [Robertmurraya siralis]|uniref:Competence protein ComEC n=1 Tax=Robertmurraya siralis TaxID=77777 RepID=A0A920BSU6_9BACI|nr:MBL fold metallo-hydrolase [Robertmurraya siralis]PAE22581.1 MBL fold metallo-hydrolase [Bacillus sp. 7504-2]GIN61011.1 competence protein ComEC [Robertmurraya siralis]
MKNLLFSITVILILVGCNIQQPSSNFDKNPASANLDISSENQFPDGELNVHFLDVGQADATLFQVAENDKQYVILIDSGDFTGNEVVSYLEEAGLEKINIAIGTHPDADHIGQMDQVLNHFDVDEVWLSGNTSQSDTFQRVLMAISENNVDYVEPRMGESYKLGPLQIDILYPQEISGKANEESISMKITYGEVSFVFTGDAEKKSEKEMIESGAQLQATFLQLGHHGSSTSTSEEFLQAVRPEVAIYSAGNDNSYGHPHEEVVSLIKNSGIALYGTDVDGTVIVTTDGKTYTIKTKKAGQVPAGKTFEQPSEMDIQNKSNGSCIDINTARAEEIEGIVHIGPERAHDLIALRPYYSIEELEKINGIGPARINDIKKEGLACIGGN